jgi:multidrug resistance efflux pump
MTQKKKTWTIASASVITVLGVAMAYYVWQSGFIETDDAVLSANQVAVSAKYPGRLAEVRVRAGTPVAAGDVIARLDTAELALQVAGAEASYRSLEARFRAAAEGARDNEIAAAQAARQEAESTFAQAERELARAKQLYATGAVSNDALERAQAARDTAQSRLDRAESQVNLLRGGLKKAELRAAAFEADRAHAQWFLLKTQLAAATITAPVSGTVANQIMHSGEFVQPGQTIVYVTDESDLWVTAYLEEGKVAPIKVGMPVHVHLDALDQDVPGKVRLIGNTAASVFSMFPPDRAAGNYTKVSQRIPIEIAIDAHTTYIPGSSAVVKFLLP